MVSLTRMLTFVALCLASRLAYSFNDLFTGRLARREGRVEVAALRGASLAVSMAPLLLWVPSESFGRLGRFGGELALTCALTAASNVLQLEAARFLPFGARAALIVGGVSGGSLLLGWLLSGEVLAATDVALGLLVMTSAVAASGGAHATNEIDPNPGKGALLSLGSAALAAIVSWEVQNLARRSNALLVAWAWEGGSGLVLLGPLLLWPGVAQRLCSARRFMRIALASLPTVVGSGASVLALSYGELGLWGAFAGTQILFTVALGTLLHRERLGALRAVCFALAAGAIAALALRRVPGSASQQSQVNPSALVYPGYSSVAFPRAPAA
ncbi:MAG TPA: hypothetical protein VFQ61_17990 [Polyangiaceae bacterium]|nr:hypothetical protein [Polyangiaceae bacterium]